MAKKAVAVARKITGKPTPPPGKMSVTVNSYRLRLCDLDNLFVKKILDAVRYAGYISDDNPDAIDLAIKQTKVSKRKLEGTKITIDLV